MCNPIIKATGVQTLNKHFSMKKKVNIMPSQIFTIGRTLSFKLSFIIKISNNNSLRVYKRKGCIFVDDRVIHLFSFLCCVVLLCVLFVIVLCLVCSMMPVSLSCSFLDASLLSLTFIFNYHVLLVLTLFQDTLMGD